MIPAPFSSLNEVSLAAAIIIFLCTVIAAIGHYAKPPTPRDTAIEAQREDLPGAPYEPPVEFYLVLASVAFIAAVLTFLYTIGA